MAVEWLALGLAVAKMLLRAADKENAADNIIDAQSGWAALRAARSNENALGKIIGKELEQRLVGGPDAVENDLRAAALDVADLFSRLADDDDALIAAATYSNQFLDYANKHGGDQKRRLISQRATPVFDHILEVTCGEFARLAPSSSGPAGPVILWIRPRWPRRDPSRAS